MKVCFFFIFVLTSLLAAAQPNCNFFKFTKDSVCYAGCLEALKAAELNEGSLEEIGHYQRSIELCPSFDYSYYELSLIFIRRGDLISWKKYIDQAVALKPKQHLGNRAWSRILYLKDFNGGIADIERLDSLTGSRIGYSFNGDYQLNIAKAICYNAIGNPKKGIAIIELQLTQKDYTAGPYDYLHLGIMRLASGDVLGAIETLKKQIAYNDYQAETYYYLGMAWKELKVSTEATLNLQKARSWYEQNYRLTAMFSSGMGKIYLEDIERELAEIR